MKETETTKRGPGRPALCAESKMKRVNIIVDKRTLETLRRYGNGNLSLGVRMAARMAERIIKGDI